MSANRDIDDILLNKPREAKQQNEVDQRKLGCIVVFATPIVFTLMLLFAWNVGIEPFFKTLGNISVWQALGLTVGFSVALVLLLTLVTAVRGK